MGTGTVGRARREEVITILLNLYCKTSASCSSYVNKIALSFFLNKQTNKKALQHQETTITLQATNSSVQFIESSE